MKTVRDDDGNRFLLLKRSEKASLVRDPETGEECYLQNDRLEPVSGASALEIAASTVEEPVRALVTAVHTERDLGLVLEITDVGPLAVPTILERYDLCETEVHGRLAELQAAGLLEETQVDGYRGYRATDRCERAVELVRESPAATVPSESGTSRIEGEVLDE